MTSYGNVVAKGLVADS